MRYRRRFIRRGSRKFRLRRMRKYKAMKSEKRKLGLSGMLVYGGLPERKTMILTKAGELDFTTGKLIDKIALSPKTADDWTTLYKIFCTKEATDKTKALYRYLPNWDKICVSRIYIKLIPEYNTYNANGSTTIPEFNAYYVIGSDGTAADSLVEKYSKVKQTINFEGSKTVTVLLNKPSVWDGSSSIINRYGTYLSMESLAPDVQDVPMLESVNPGSGDEDSQYDEEEDEEPEWGVSVAANNCYGNFCVKSSVACKLRYKVYYKVHLRG